MIRFISGLFVTIVKTGQDCPPFAYLVLEVYAAGKAGMGMWLIKHQQNPVSIFLFWNIISPLIIALIVKLV
jgi:hypothetical protein